MIGGNAASELRLLHHTAGVALGHKQHRASDAERFVNFGGNAVAHVRVFKRDKAQLCRRKNGKNLFMRQHTAERNICQPFRRSFFGQFGALCTVAEEQEPRLRASGLLRQTQQHVKSLRQTDVPDVYAGKNARRRILLHQRAVQPALQHALVKAVPEKDGLSLRRNMQPAQMRADLFHLAGGNRRDGIAVPVHKIGDPAEHAAGRTVLTQISHLHRHVRPNVPNIKDELCSLAPRDDPAGQADQKRRRRGNDNIRPSGGKR